MLNGSARLRIAIGSAWRRRVPPSGRRVKTKVCECQREALRDMAHAHELRDALPLKYLGFRRPPGWDDASRRSLSLSGGARFRLEGKPPVRPTQRLTIAGEALQVLYS